MFFLAFRRGGGETVPPDGLSEPVIHGVQGRRVGVAAGRVGVVLLVVLLLPLDLLVAFVPGSAARDVPISGFLEASSLSYLFLSSA